MNIHDAIFLFIGPSFNKFQSLESYFGTELGSSQKKKPCNKNYKAILVIRSGSSTYILS